MTNLTFIFLIGIIFFSAALGYLIAKKTYANHGSSIVGAAVGFFVGNLINLDLWLFWYIARHGLL